MTAVAKKIPVGILGATGTVGQRFIQLLETHPLLVVAAVGASGRSAGKLYKECTAWKLDTPIPPATGMLVVQTCDPACFTAAHCQIIFSGLDAAVAGDIELAFLKAEFAVFSNAKNHRMNACVPIIVPLVNPNHFDIIPHQRSLYSLNRGFLVTNANCSTTGLVVALKPLQDAFGPLSRVVVTTMQAISGGGYPGVPSLDILGNVVPYISGEEEKMEEEALKILGTLEFQRRPAPTMEQIENALTNYISEPQKLSVHSAPERAVVITHIADRPQPRLDVRAGNGNAVVVGRIRPCSIFDVKFTLLSHNTILGAAGSSIMNAEIAVARGMI
ncbi:aspartate-semialdehyde dehydrogenase [Batrachochytrium salamandrivorans]|nr:aspartate-semialdehyde dehydrogenase [Batrachochytrium salamandrivorans]